MADAVVVSGRQLTINLFMTTGDKNAFTILINTFLKYS
jgi:hypothetical protein